MPDSTATATTAINAVSSVADDYEVIVEGDEVDEFDGDGEPITITDIEDDTNLDIKVDVGDIHV